MRRWRGSRADALRPAAHLTCVGAARGEIDVVVRGYLEAGVRHIVALRGDPPAGADAPYQPSADGYRAPPNWSAGIKAIGW